MKKQTKQDSIRPRQRRDEVFKREAVALLEAGRGLKQLAGELGISYWTLRDWRELYGAGGARAGLPAARSAGQTGEGAASTIALSVQLADLRRELEATQRQRDILKKALAIVGQEDLNASSSSRP